MQVGRRLVTALRDQGAYVAGISDGDTVQLRADLAAVAAYGTTIGHPFATDRALRPELRAAVAALAVVTDNAPGSVGGAGPRRAATAAPLLRSTPPATGSAGPSPGQSPSGSSSSVGPSPGTPGAGSSLTASGPAPGSSATRLPSAPAAQVGRPDPAPPAVVAGIAALALALFVVGLRAGRGLTRLFS
jgi:hypothetical protein